MFGLIRVGSWQIRRLTFGLAVLVVMAVVSTAHAGVVFHNGLSTAPSHSAGNNVVDVDFVIDLAPAPGILAAATIFNENASHNFEYLYENPEPPLLFVSFAALNLTGEAWIGYEFRLGIGEFFGIVDGSPARGDLARAINPVVTTLSAPDDILFSPGAGDSITVDGSTIVRSGNIATLSIEFGELVQPGETFAMGFFIDDLGLPDPGFTMWQTPTPIPAPGAAILALLGFGAVGPVRRWFR